MANNTKEANGALKFKKKQSKDRVKGSGGTDEAPYQKVVNKKRKHGLLN